MAEASIFNTWTVHDFLTFADQEHMQSTECYFVENGQIVYRRDGEQ